MKRFLLLLTLVPCALFGQTVLSKNKTFVIAPQVTFHQNHNGPDFAQQDSLTKAGITFDTWIGETYYYSAPANGWRSDTISGWSINVYQNPYITNHHTQYETKKAETQEGHKLTFYFYKEGKRFTGPVKDSLPYGHWGTFPQFEGQCVNGVLQGQARFYYTLDDDPYMGDTSKNQLKSEGEFAGGEMVGPWKVYERNGQLKETRYYVKGQPYPEKIVPYKP